MVKNLVHRHEVPESSLSSIDMQRKGQGWRIEENEYIHERKAQVLTDH